MYKVNYFYVRNKRRKKRNITNWVYPKPYVTIVNDEELAKIKEKDGFLLTSSIDNKSKKVESVAIVAQVTPATEKDIATYKHIDLVGSYQLHEGQIRAVKNFMKIKFGIES